MPALLLSLLLAAPAAIVDVAPGGDLAAALAAAGPGGTVRLPPGTWPAALGRVRGALRVEGAGAGRTTLVAPEGEDGVVVEAGGDVALEGLSLVAGPAHAGLKVLGGAARLADVVLEGGACGAYLDGGRLTGRGVDLAGDYGLLATRAEVALSEGSARGASAGVGVLSGARVRLARFAITGPSREAGLSVAGGEAALEAVVIRAPGPAGLAVAGAPSRVDAVELDVAGAVESGGFLGDCLQVQRGALRVEGGLLAGCAGAAAEAMGGTLRLAGVSARGGSAGCLVLLDGASAELVGNTCGGPGPGLVAAAGAKATARFNRWRTDPALWVDCGSGAQVAVGAGEQVAEPCRPAR